MTMAKKKPRKRTPEEQAAYDRRTREAWERIAERGAIDRAADAARKRA
jgi:hypothetical protein